MKNLSKKIFIVDDDPFHLELMQQILKTQLEDEIITFSSGIDCLLEIHENPHIVFLDHQMDVYNGYETLRKIKRHNPNIFVVMVSAQAEIETAVNTLKYGAFDYLQKDSKLETKVMDVIQRIEGVKELLETRKTSFFKHLFSFI
jgi:DNA-binding NtrC family response regulator